MFLPLFSLAQSPSKQGNNPSKPQRVPLNNAIDSFSYALGINISNSLIQQGVTVLNIGAMSQAFLDIMTNKDKQFSPEVANAIIQQRFQEIQKKNAEESAGDEGGVAIGKTIPDFEQTDVDGKMINIQSYRGKYVLVDFWASWCGPCRGENPNVVNAYNRFKDKNFTVLGVSLDKSKEPWIQAINKDGLVWKHVSDLQGWSNSVAQKFGITSIPQNYLIDPNGIVIGKNLRGAALEAKLESILK